MLDHPYIGALYTWTNKREGSQFLARKLDRILVSPFWFDWFPQFGEFLSPGVSDHAAYFVSSQGSSKCKQ